MKSLLEQLPGVGEVSVHGSGRYDSGYVWRITFHTNFGDLPELEVVSHLNGTEVNITVDEIIKGSLDQFQILRANYFSTIEGSSQLRLSSNSINAICHEDCSFEFTKDTTPSIVDVQPSSGSIGTIFTITGNGFNPILEDNTVIIGDNECTVISASDTQLLCKSGPLYAGENPVSVNSAMKGNASGLFFVRGQLKVHSMYPLEAGFGGGSVLSIYGEGFRTGDTLVEFDDGFCEPITETHDKIECIIPPLYYELYSNSTDEYEDSDIEETITSLVYVHVGEETLRLSSNFTYVKSFTPQIFYVIPELVSAAISKPVRIVGEGFSSIKEDISLSIGTEQYEIVSATDTEIEFITQPTAPGIFPLVVNIAYRGIPLEETLFSFDFSLADRKSVV